MTIKPMNSPGDPEDSVTINVSRPFVQVAVANPMPRDSQPCASSAAPSVPRPSLFLAGPQSTCHRIKRPSRTG